MKKSAGILAYRIVTAELQFFLVHPGGPFFAKKDHGAWTIPKGEIEEGEDPLATATREFTEETGIKPSGQLSYLGEIKQKAGKVVMAWAVGMDVDAGSIVSNTFEIEWPPHSGKQKKFPEIDKAAWFNYEEACIKINPAQQQLIDLLMASIT